MSRPRDELQAALSDRCSRQAAEILALRGELATTRERAEQADRAIRWAVELEQQLAEATRLLTESYLLRSAVKFTPERAFRFQYDVDAFLKAAHPVDCDECDGAGERLVSGDPRSDSYETATCRACGGLG